METASLVVDIHKIRCGGCKVIVKDGLAEQCTVCDAVFDRVTSNHVGLAQNLINKREEAGIRFEKIEVAGLAESETANASDHEPASTKQKLTASIVVDIHNTRGGNCKVVINDELDDECEICGAVFDRVVSNHVGLAAKLQQLRGSADENGQTPSTANDEAPELVKS